MKTNDRQPATGPLQGGLATSRGSDPRKGGAWGHYFEISQRFFFDAAHTLQRDIETEGSRRIHGHTYNADVTLSGKPDPKTGMVVDLGLVRRAIEQLRPQLDHHLLDEVPDLGPATLENLCLFIWRDLAARLPGLTQVRVWRDGIGDSCTLR